MRSLLLLFSFFFLTLLSGFAADIKVFAAASLTDALQEIAKNYSAKTSDKIIFNFAGSQILSRQIMQDAPADLFFSADEAQMEAVAKAGRLIENTRRSLLSNSLVIIAPKDFPGSSFAPGDLALPAFNRIALADPRTVPAGVYAKAYLTKIGIWEKISPRVIPTENVRAALAAVSSGNVEGGIVYKTDVLKSSSVKVLYEVPLADGPVISYPVARLKNGTQPVETQKFLDYLESADAVAVFKKNGFLIMAK